MKIPPGYLTLKEVAEKKGMTVEGIRKQILKIKPKRRVPYPFKDSPKRTWIIHESALNNTPLIEMPYRRR